MKLTQANVARLKLPASKGEAIYFDDDLPCLGLRLREGGSRTWIVQYRVGKKQRRLTLGSTAILDSGKAKDAARDALARVRLGGDPSNDKALARVVASETFDVIAERFLARQETRLRPSSYAATKYYLLTLFKPLHRLTLAHVTRAAVAGQLGRIADGNGPVAADRARAALSAFFAWAIREGVAESNPVVGTNKATDPEDTKRDRVLSHNELRTIWRNLGDDHFADIVRLLMLTGQRRDEIADLQWSEIDFSKRVISLPASRTKNKRAHDIPLSKAALAILKRQPRLIGREFVFGEGGQGFQGWSRAKAALDARVKLNQPWQLRDLRRTVVTGMGDLEVPPHVVEAIVNHVSGTKGGVAGIYNKSTYGKEKVAALNKWDAKLERLNGPSTERSNGKNGPR